MVYKRVFDELCHAEHPILICDERIDGDSLGSALAMADLFKQIGRPLPRVYVAENIPAVYRHLPHLDLCTTDIQMFNDPTIDLVVVFDCSDDRFVSALMEKIPSSPTLINIDHHKTNSFYGDINLVIPTAPATAEVMYRLFDYNGVIPSKQSASCLLTGLCFDTTAFSNSGTTHGALETASKLILCGARIQDAIRSMFKNRSIPALRVWGAALERLHNNKEFNCVATCILRKDMEENTIADEEVEGLSNFLSLVTDTDTLYVLRETPDGHVKVSMRSQTRDVSAVAKAQGGGGHESAAGYTVKNSHLVCGKDGCWGVVGREVK